LELTVLLVTVILVWTSKLSKYEKSVEKGRKKGFALQPHHHYGCIPSYHHI